MDAGALFDAFVSASTFRTIYQTFLQLCLALEVDPSDGKNVYRGLRKLKEWKAEKLWKLLDKRFTQKEYLQQKGGDKLTTLVIGAGPCGLRMAIESALLGNRVVVVEQRDKFSRNNVLHLWEFVIHDIKALGAKIFYPKFCTGSIEHISIRQLQCILLKVALCFGVQVHEGVSFKEIVFPPNENTGYKAIFEPSNHILSELEFDVLIGADGKRNTVPGFRRDELRGKLAIAITANFINKRTPAEEKVAEISGVAYIFNQSFFKEMYETTGVDLENIVYYKDETHYFVMCAKKQSLLDMGVLKKDCDDAVKLLSASNLDKDALCNYAVAAANFATKGALPTLEFAENHRGEKDIAAFDFTSLYSAKHSVRLVERKGKRLLMGIIGDSLHEPFWPTGSGCARGFLGVFDTAWLIRDYGLNQKGPLEMIAERESVYRLLAQVTKDNMHKLISKYTIDPRTRYMHPDLSLEPDEVVSLVNSDNPRSLPVSEPLPLNKLVSAHSFDNSVMSRYALWRFCCHVLLPYKLKIVDLDKSWCDGLALAGLLAKFSPKSLDYFNILAIDDSHKRLEACFQAAKSAFGVDEPCDPASWDGLHLNKKVDYIGLIVKIIRNDMEYVQRCLITPRSMKRKIVEQPRPRPARRATQPIEKLAMDLLESFKGDDSKKKIRDSETKRRLERLQRQESDPIPKVKVGEFKNDISARKMVEKLRMEAGSENKKSIEGLNDISVGNTKDITKSLQELDGDGSNGASFTKWRSSASDHACERVQSDTFEKENGIAKVKPISSVQPKRHSVPVMPSETVNATRQIYCDICGKVVYLAERMQVESVYIHKNCFRCSFCSQPLRLGEYGKDKELEYTHPKKLFCNVHLRVPLREKINQIERITKRASNRLSATVSPMQASHASSSSPDAKSEETLTSRYYSLLTTPHRMKESRSIISPISELTNDDDRTPERAEFGTHITEKTTTVFKPDGSESEEEDFTQNLNIEAKADSDEDPSLSDCDNLEEDDLEVFQNSVLQLDDEFPEMPVTDEQIVSIIDRMNRRRRSLLPGTPTKEEITVDEFFTPDVVFRKPPSSDSSRERAKSLIAVPTESEFSEFKTPLNMDIRKQKADELEKLRSELRRKAQMKTDDELGIGSNLAQKIPIGTARESSPIAPSTDSSTVLSTPVKDNRKVRTSALLDDMPSMRRESSNISISSLPERNEKGELVSPKIAPVGYAATGVGMIYKMLGPETQKRDSVFQSDQLHIESRKETGLLEKPYHRIKQRRETNSPTHLSTSSNPDISVTTDQRVAHIAPSPRVTSENIESSITPSHISVDPATLRQFHKKAEKIKRQRDQGLSQNAQELQLNIERNEVRLNELTAQIRKKQEMLDIDPDNQSQLIRWLELIKERDSLHFVNRGKILELQKVKLHVRYRELNRKCSDSDDMAEPVTLEEMLRTVREKEEVDSQLTNYAKECLRSPPRIEDVLRVKKFNYRNFEKDFRLIAV